MKRLITILCSICLCVMANAQIQTKFWGLELSKSYISLYAVKNMISDKCERIEIKDNSISGRNGKFGGYNWGFVDFGFYKEASSHFTLSQVYFTDYSDYKTAKERYDYLLSALSNKYGESNTKISSEQTVNYWSMPSKPHCCFLFLKKQNDISEDCWSTTLVYSNHELLKLTLKEDTDEL